MSVGRWTTSAYHFRETKNTDDYPTQLIEDTHNSTVLALALTEDTM